MPKLFKLVGTKLTFWCPACKVDHAIPDNVGWNGDAESPTVQPVLAFGDCHLRITQGKIEYHPHSDHELAGTVKRMVPPAAPATPKRSG